MTKIYLNARRERKRERERERGGGERKKEDTIIYIGNCIL